jgi:hypothetical protein
LRVRLERATMKQDKTQPTELTSAGPVTMDPVFELYHDMYAPLLWTWRADEERKKQIRTTVLWVAVAVMLLVTVGNPLWQWSLRRQLLAGETGKPGYPTDLSQAGDLREVRNAFAHSIIWMWVGNHLWRENCNRYASYLALSGKTDLAVWYQSASLQVDKTSLEIKNALGPAGYLLNTIKGEGFVDVLINVKPDKNRDGPINVIAGTLSGKLIRFPGKDLDIARINNSIPESSKLRVLCLSPTGSSAAVAYVKATGVVVNTVSTNDGKIENNSLAPVFSTVLLNAPDLDDSALALDQLSAKFSFDGKYLGILFAKTVIVYDTKTGKPVAWSPNTVNVASKGKQIASPANVAEFSFAPSNPKLIALSLKLKSGDTPVIGQQVILTPLPKLAFWEIGKEIGLTQGELPEGARPVFGCEEEVLAISGGSAAGLQPERTWKWFSRTEMQSVNCRLPRELLFPPGSVPQGFDPQENTLLSTDTDGEFIVSTLSPEGSKSFVLGVSVNEQRGARVTTIASVSDVHKKGVFASIDRAGSLVRVWRVPEKSLGFDDPKAEKSLGFDDPKASPPPLLPDKNRVWLSRDGEWRANWDVGHLSLTPTGSGTSGKSSWSLELKERPENVRISSGGDCVMIFLRGELLYASRAWSKTSPGYTDININSIKGLVRDVAFGPGGNRITVASDEEMAIFRSPDIGEGELLPPSLNFEWSAPTGRSRLMEGDKNEVILLSTVWVHRFSYPDSVMSRIHRFFEGRSVSEPEISSKMAIAPIDIDAQDAVPVPGKVHLLKTHTLVPLDQIAPKDSIGHVMPRDVNLIRSVSNSFVLNVNWCDPDPDPSHSRSRAAASEVVCEWETRSGLRISEWAHKDR